MARANPTLEKAEISISPAPAKKPRLPWRQRVSVATLLLWTALLAILGAGGSAGYYAYQVLYENKLTDTWAILFLELERQGNELSQRLEQFGAPTLETPATGGRALSSTEAAPDLILRRNADNTFETLRGAAPAKIKLGDLHLKGPELSEPRNVLQLAGVDYLTVPADEVAASRAAGEPFPPGRYFLMRKVDIGSWFVVGQRSLEGVTAYIITRQGSLLYSNSPQITEGTYYKRPLVQKFVAAPLRQGQFDFLGDEGPSYGFFYEVPKTNLLIFLETPRKIALASVHQVALRYGMILLIILGVAALILQFPLNAMLAPMRELVRLSWEMGEGNFDAKPNTQGFGELHVLSRSFYDMGQNLKVREEKIKRLLVEQEEKFRLADELAIAQSIQENFLFKAPLPRDSGLEVATHYTPAAECAGDWYGYFYNDATDESVFAIADVSGHGAGSAMFTAIIAATFEEMRTQHSNSTFALDEFAHRLNRLFLKLGRGNWHCTLLITRYDKGAGSMEVLNAGHPFPLVVQPGEKGVKPQPLDLRSDLLGISLDFKPASAKLEFPKATSLFLYTDGLIEGRPDRKPYSPRRLNKACYLQSHQTIGVLVENVYHDWQAHLEGQPALDDVCLMAVRAL